MSLLNSNKEREMPRALRGFEHINRYWDKQNCMFAAKILPGEYYVTNNHERIVTVLGSCVAACIRDRVNGIGGMNHFMLPMDSLSGSWDVEAFGVATRFGNVAMERLINDILKNGGRRQNLEVKLFGGGNVLVNMTDVGQKNILFVKHFAKMEGLNVVAEDLGDVYPRKVHYIPSTGKVFVKRFHSVNNDTISERERNYMRSIKQQNDGSIDLF